jgi:hypothetical protein
LVAETGSTNANGVYAISAAKAEGFYGYPDQLVPLMNNPG